MPDNLLIDPKVLMNNPVPHSNDPMPDDLGMFFPNGMWHPVRSFAYDLNISDDHINRLFIAREFSKQQTPRLPADLHDRFEHIVNQDPSASPRHTQRLFLCPSTTST
jgi:hypothetical protein